MFVLSPTGFDPIPMVHTSTYSFSIITHHLAPSTKITLRIEHLVSEKYNSNTVGLNVG
jgi:hypothetical protein